MDNFSDNINKGIWLQKMKWKKVADYRNKGIGVILIPIGSTEQHGYHLPLGTDTMVAIKLAEDAAKKTNTIVIPPLWFGWSPHHLALPGTISIRAEVLIEVLFDIINSLSMHGFKNFVVVNGHRVVNIPWMQIAAERAQSKLHVKVEIFDPAWMIKDIAKELDFPFLSHADEIETSHLLYINEDLVDLNMAVDYQPESERMHYSADPRSEKDTLCSVTKTIDDIKKIVKKSGGSVGRPSNASKEKGKIMHEHLVRRLTEVIEELKK